MLAAVKPRTMATTLMRISRAMETVEGDKSIECLILKDEKAMACLTATSETSIYRTFIEELLDFGQESL